MENELFLYLSKKKLTSVTLKPCHLAIMVMFIKLNFVHDLDMYLNSALIYPLKARLLNLPLLSPFATSGLFGRVSNVISAQYSQVVAFLCTHMHEEGKQWPLGKSLAFSKLKIGQESILRITWRKDLAYCLYVDEDKIMHTS